MEFTRLVAVLGLVLLAGVQSRACADPLHTGPFLIHEVALTPGGDLTAVARGNRIDPMGVGPGPAISVAVKKDDKSAPEIYQTFLAAYTSKATVKMTFDAHGHVVKIELKK